MESTTLKNYPAYGEMPKINPNIVTIIKNLIDMRTWESTEMAETEIVCLRSQGQYRADNSLINLADNLMSLLKQ